MGYFTRPAPRRSSVGGEVFLFAILSSLFLFSSARTAHAQDVGRPGWTDFTLGGLHPYAGVSWLGGPALPIAQQAGDAQGSFLFALRAGLLLGTQEIGVEVSPMTYFYANGIPGPALQANVTFGNYFRLRDRIYYPLRLGAGVFAVNTPRDHAFFQARADVVGIAFNVGHLLFEVHAPSFRWATDFQSPVMTHFLSWEFGASATYVL